MITEMWELLIFAFLAIFSKSTQARPYFRPGTAFDSTTGSSFCLSWRLAVEVNNIRGWRTVPNQCVRYVETYMLGGQYDRDVALIVEQVKSYVDEIILANDGMDAWILDVDDTCISNVYYYRVKRYGCDPYDPNGFMKWATKAGCPAIPAMLDLFRMLIEKGLKVFIVTGRDESTLGEATYNNLHNQGFAGYERLIMRTAAEKGQSAVAFKSGTRQRLMEEGYRIWGNMGDQWSDIQGVCQGNRTFKLPNPMYFVP